MAAACVIAAMNRGTQVLFWNYLSMGLRGGGIFLPLTLSVFFPGHLKRGWAVLSMAGSTVAAILAVVLHLPIGFPLRGSHRERPPDPSRTQAEESGWGIEMV